MDRTARLRRLEVQLLRTPKARGPLRRISRLALYWNVIKSFRDRESERLYTTGHSRRFQHCARRALQKLRMIDAAGALADLQVLPGNRLERLAGDRGGQNSIRINDQYRICFVWSGGDAYDVEITDYH